MIIHSISENRPSPTSDMVVPGPARLVSRSRWRPGPARRPTSISRLDQSRPLCADRLERVVERVEMSTSICLCLSFALIDIMLEVYRALTSLLAPRRPGPA